MLPDVFADAHLVRAEHGVAFCDRDAACAVVWLDQRFVRQRPLLHFADYHGPVHVFGLEDDPNDHHGPAAADDDEDHAGYDGRAIHDLSHLERSGGIYSYQQLGRDFAAVVAEPHASFASGGSDPDAWKKRKKQEEVTHLASI